MGLLRLKARKRLPLKGKASADLHGWLQYGPKLLLGPWPPPGRINLVYTLFSQNRKILKDISQFPLRGRSGDR